MSETTTDTRKLHIENTYQLHREYRELMKETAFGNPPQKRLEAINTRIDTILHMQQHHALILAGYLEIELEHKFDEWQPDRR